VAVAAVCCLASREEFRFGEAVRVVRGRLLDVDVLAVTSAVTPGWRSVDADPGPTTQICLE
jgi:hypothetical protein